MKAKNNTIQTGKYKPAYREDIVFEVTVRFSGSTRPTASKLTVWKREAKKCLSIQDGLVTPT